MRKLVVGFAKFLVFCVFVVGAIAIADEKAPPKPAGPTAEDEMAMQALESLVNIPDQKENSPHLAYLMKKEVARTIIYDLAARLKLKKTEEGYHTTINKEDLSKALKLLNGNIARFADKNYGDNNKIISLEEFDKFLKETKGLPGIQVMREMFLKQ